MRPGVVDDRGSRRGSEWIVGLNEEGFTMKYDQDRKRASVVSIHFLELELCYFLYDHWLGWVWSSGRYFHFFDMNLSLQHCLRYYFQLFYYLTTP